MKTEEPVVVIVAVVGGGGGVDEEMLIGRYSIRYLCLISEVEIGSCQECVRA